MLNIQGHLIMADIEYFKKYLNFSHFQVLFDDLKPDRHYFYISQHKEISTSFMYEMNEIFI